jgi:hypothetical protein
MFVEWGKYENTTAETKESVKEGAQEEIAEAEVKEDIKETEVDRIRSVELLNYITKSNTKFRQLCV